MLFAGYAIPRIGRIGDAIIEVQAAFDFARVACELERYFLANGAYPESLQQLLAWDKIEDAVQRSQIQYHQSDDGRYELKGEFDDWRYRRVADGSIPN